MTVVEPLLAEAACIEGFTAFEGDTERALQQWTDGIAAALAGTGRISRRIVVGRPPEEILESARTEQADLVVNGWSQYQMVLVAR